MSKAMNEILHELHTSTDSRIVAARENIRVHTWAPAYRELHPREIEMIERIARAHYMARTSRLMYWQIYDKIELVIVACSRRGWLVSRDETIDDGNLKTRVQRILDGFDPLGRVQPTKPGWYKARWGGMVESRQEWICLQVFEGCTDNGLTVTDWLSDCGVATSRVLEWGAEIPMLENDR